MSPKARDDASREEDMLSLKTKKRLKAILAASLLSPLALSQVVAPGTPQTGLAEFDVLRVNCGGALYTDPQGNDWVADFGFNAGSVGSTLNPIANTDLDALYQSDRQDAPGRPELIYNFALRRYQTYEIDLHFAETDAAITGAGQRVFDVLVDGNVALAGVDPFAQSGALDTALVHTIQAFASGPSLSIQFNHVLGDPSIEGIHIRRPAQSMIDRAPVITSTPLQVATEAVPYSYDLNATNHNASVGDVTLYSMEVGPLGATIDPLSGVLSWTPTGQFGLFEFVLRATDNAGQFDEQTFFVDSRYRINCGGTTNHIGPQGETWTADFGFNTGGTYSTTEYIFGTQNLVLYKVERNDPPRPPDLLYSLSVPNGPYIVRLHLAEIAPAVTAPGIRVFDIKVEGQTAFVDYDIFAESGAHRTAIQEDVLVNVTDGSVDIDFVRKLGFPKLSGIEVLAGGQMLASPDSITWGHVPLGQTGITQEITLDNVGLAPLHITELTYRHLAGSAGHDFLVTLDGNVHMGDHQTTSVSVDVTIPVGQSLVVPVVFQPTEEVATVIDLEFSGNFATQAVELSAIGGSGSGYLHVVITAPEVAVDFDGNGSEDIFLNGTDSHTHELGESIILYDWVENGNSISNQVSLTHNLALGDHTLELTIGDSATPQKFLTDQHTVRVVPIDLVPGMLALTYESPGVSPNTLLNSVPAMPDWAQEIDGAFLDALETEETQVLLRLVGDVDILTADTYEFFLTSVGPGGVQLLVDDVQTAGPIMLSVGRHRIDARFAVFAEVDLPVEVQMAQGVGAPAPIDQTLLSHDFTSFAPVLNRMNPFTGNEAGGNQVVLTGIGFFLETQVQVQWGGVTIPNNQLTVTPTSIALTTPPGTGSVAVSVTTPRGTSKSKVFEYDPSGPLPIDFSVRVLQAGISQPTVGAWGPDGKFYVGTVSGTIHVIEVDDNYVVTGTSTIGTIAALGNPTILGIAFNPFDPPTVPRLYVAHSSLYSDGGGCLTGAFVSYSSEVSILEGPGFAVTPLITGLPASNHDHAVNGMVFDRNGDLYVNVGGNTNAGIRDCALGDLPESPFAAATIKAEISKPGFNGIITYTETNSGLPNNDQAFGDLVDPDAGLDLTIFAAGQRNPFDLIYTTWDMLYATDNGPNAGFGESTIANCVSSLSQPTTQDELNLLEFGRYYGHPNCNRARTDARQSEFYNLAGLSIIGEFTQALAAFPPSVNGVEEYRSNTFNGAMRGALVAQKLASTTYLIELSADKRSVVNSGPVPTLNMGCLDVVTGPGGVLVGVNHYGNSVLIAEPNDPSAIGLLVYDITPWRAPAAGGHEFVIAGSQFGTQLANVSVTIGGLPATLTSVSDTRIRGTVPIEVSPTSELLDVAVTVNAASKTLPAAFRYLQPAGYEPWAWREEAPMPGALGEVGAGIVNDKLYVFGEGLSTTYEYDLLNKSWSTKAPRPFNGNHHSVVTEGGKLYIFGGLDNGSEGKVQIYDPLLDSWSLGALMPWFGGSCSATLINGLVYVCGGIQAGVTVDHLAAYDPVADTWSSLLTSMPVGRNHAAATTDGTRLYVFGGRTGGNTVANGFNETQIYDPQTNTWESSLAGGTPLPLPQKRGGMGAAIYYGGEIYVMGGETWNGPGATPDGVYDRVDIYDPLANSWRVGAPMPTARHGIYPLLNGQQIYVVGGGETQGYSQSTRLEVYAP